MTRRGSPPLFLSVRAGAACSRGTGEGRDLRVATFIRDGQRYAIEGAGEGGKARTNNGPEDSFPMREM